MTKYNVTIKRGNLTDFTGLATFRGLSDFNDDEVLETLEGVRVARYTACMGWTRPDGTTAVEIVACEAE
jgi:hypothetical protein